MHGHDPADRVWACPDPRCSLTYSTPEAARRCALRHAEDDDDTA